ncbi:E2 family protein B [Rhizobiales bacterium GAS188]|nr:E2 family protein B [Rhizobiales bacterium GAS188]
MPEGPAAPIITGSDRFSTAAAKVEGWLHRLGGSPEPLSGLDRAGYPGRGFAAGWRLAIQFSDRRRRLDVLLPAGFPWMPPRIALVDRPPFLTWPHVERDGVLCLASGNLSVDADQPAEVVGHLLGLAAELIEMLIRGEGEADFRDEFLSYWSFAANKDGPPVVSLIEPAPPSREIRLWRGKGLYVVGDSDKAVKAWLANRFGTKLPVVKTAPAALLWMGEPPTPRGYPETALAFRTMAKHAGEEANSELERLMARQPAKMLSVLGFTTANGPALAGVIASPPQAQPRGTREPLTKGFRPGFVPSEILMRRYFGGGNVLRTEVARADAAWIHGRDQDERAVRLRGATIVIAGCGSIGAPLAIALAQAGAGRLVLIDFDTLKWANLGRHPLGAPYVGQPKSKALADRLRTDFPHMMIEHRVARLDAVIRSTPEILRECDLIVSATGSWAADSHLDAWYAETGRVVPIVYGWTEPHACAGHAVLIKGEGCLRCGFDGPGLPNLTATAWPGGPTERQEPACSAAYQPYGPVEIGFINSLVAELTLDAVLGEHRSSIHRIWVAPEARLARLGGEWTPEWRRLSANRGEGGFVLSVPWAEASCPRCRKALAA